MKYYYSHFRITFLLFIVSLNCISQADSTHKVKPYSYFEFKGGVGFPLGSFSGAQTYSYNGTTGYTIGFSVSAPLKKSYFSAMLFANYGENGFDESALYADTYNQAYIQNTTQRGNYIQKNVLCGVSYSFAGDEKSSLDFRLLAGVMVFYTPEIIYSQTNPGATGNQVYMYTWDVKQTNFSAFAYNIGGSFKSLVGKRFIFSLNLDFFVSNNDRISIITYEYIKYVNSLYTVDVTPTASSPHIVMFNPTIGIGYKIEN